MIQVEKLSYGFPAKDLYKEVSFTLKMGQHCALIGSNGSGKSTLVDMMIHPDQYLYDGKIIKDESCRIGYASQFAVRDKEQECTVFEYLSERFVENQQATAAVCEKMAVAEDAEPLFEKYQALLDAFEAMDGDNYTNNIRKQLYAAGMRELEETKVSQLSGGEYKLLQIMREMLLSPNLLVLDEPDVFLDFGNLNSLCQLINGYYGTLCVITHNRYLLNHCFNKILHLENGDIQEYDGNYTEYRCSQLREKLKLKLQSTSEQEEIQRTEKMVDILRKRATILVNPVIGSAVNAKQTQLDRLCARQIKPPFI
ncbi:MAG: ATP-binding cassette domain-containing protein, partial [Bacillota bacterium]